MWRLSGTKAGESVTEYERVLLTSDEYKLIKVLIKTQRFNPDPVLVGLRKKFSVEEG